jgi:hypothetical protein
MLSIFLKILLIPIDFSLKKMMAKVVAKLFLGHYVFFKVLFS